MLDLDSHEVEVHLAENAVLEMELGMVEFEFNVQALFYSNLHLYGSVGVRFLAEVGHNELFFLRYSIVGSVDHHVDVVAQVYHNTVVALKLLLYAVELEIV